VSETVEYADRSRSASVFPRSWGTPPVDVEERQQWILARIEERQALGLGTKAKIPTRRMTAEEAARNLAERTFDAEPRVTVEGGRTTIVEVR
jgi:hypothetical protein